MKNKAIVYSLLINLLVSPITMASDGEALFNKLCISCHQVEGTPINAPPIFAVINHVKSAYPEREAFVNRVVEWVKEPNPDDVLMPGAARRFGLMPKQPYSESEVRKVAEYLYDKKFQMPEWYREHFRQMHGSEPSQ